MKIVQSLIIFVAKILIFIGDVTLLIFLIPWKILRALLRFAQIIKAGILFQLNNIQDKLPHRVVEREIYSAQEIEPRFSLPTLNLPTLNLPAFKKPELPTFKLPEISIDVIRNIVKDLKDSIASLQNDKVNLPKFKLPSLHLPSIEIPKPTFELPKINLPKINVERITIVIPSVKFPKLEFFSIKLPRFHFPKIKFPTIKLPSFRLPRLNLPSFSLRQKKRGRKRIYPIKLPFLTRFKYVFIGSFVSLIFIFMPLVVVVFIQNLPNPKELATQDISQTTKIYDRNHILLYQIYANQNRTVVPLADIPKNLQSATIAIEDKNFYSTPGFDIFAIIRSAIANISGKPIQGGSTITQQLVKARLLSPQRSVVRKVKEIVLSVWAQRIYTKSQILEMYLNQVPYGGTSWGAEAAAQTYFGKSVKDLDLAQSAFLAGLPQAPSIYSPYGDYPNSWKERQRIVLARMAESKFITKAEAKNAEAEKLKFQPKQEILHAPHFVMYVRGLLVGKYGLPMVERGGLTVVTSLDLNIQNTAQKIITDEVDNAGYLHFTNAGALVTNPTNGDILAMVGGRDYYDPNGGNYNTTTALRQPGSTIKVITYSAALLNGYTAATPIQDTPVSFAAPGAPPYTPVNYDGRFHGTVSLRDALGNSINIPAVKTLNQVGIGTMVNLAKQMGVTTWGEPQDYGLALTLGSAEVKMTDLSTAYGTLANHGKRVDLNPILKVTDYQGNVVEEKNEIQEKTVLPENVAFIISNILADNRARAMEFGLNSPLVIPGHTVSVKTGTTDNKRDNWTIGYTPNLLTAVWVGNNDNSPMNPILASGITGAAPIWNKIMNSQLNKQNLKNEIYSPPSDIVMKPCGGRNEYFVSGTENQGNCRPLSINDQKPTINP